MKPLELIKSHTVFFTKMTDVSFLNIQMGIIAQLLTGHEAAQRYRAWSPRSEFSNHPFPRSPFVPHLP
jgi:hypothetical protein